MYPAQQRMAWAALDIWGGFIFTFSTTSCKQGAVCTHLVNEAGKLCVECLDLFLLLTAYFMFQRVNPNTEGLQEPLIDADALDSFPLAIGVTPHDAESPGTAKADPSSGVTVANNPSEAEISKTPIATDPIHIGNSSAPTQVADAAAAVGSGRAPGRLACSSIAPTTDLRRWAEASPSQHGPHCRCLSAHRGWGRITGVEGKLFCRRGTEIPLGWHRDATPYIRLGSWSLIGSGR